MTRVWILIITGIFFLAPGLVYAQTGDTLDQRIILIGDAGEEKNGQHPELNLVKSLFNIDSHTTIVFLGDNIYPAGLPDRQAISYPKAKAILDDQVNIGKGNRSSVYFIPGNHDWMQGGPGGWQQVIHESQYIESLGLPNVQLVPENGCPGPVEINLSDDIVLVVMDSQWWLHPFEKPTKSSGCACTTKDEFITALKDIMYRNRNKLVLFATHHPFKTYGTHGGHFTWKEHLFPLTALQPNLYIPLPVIGSIYPVARGVFGNIQDTRHPIYREMTSEVEAVLNTHPYCIRVAGHDHNLQFIQSDDKDYIVSGGGSKSAPVTMGKGSLFAEAKTGFAVLEIYKSGKINLKFYSSSNTNPELPLFTKSLEDFKSLNDNVSTMTIAQLPDSVVSVGSADFHAGAIKKYFLGTNYRNEWATPVRAEVFDIGSVNGGLIVTQKGGGHQTKSFRLKDSTGKEYVLRSINKNVDDAALPEAFRGTFVKDLVKDGVSASYPYAALSVPPLAAVAGIPHASPQVVYIPDDPRFGIYRPDVANQLFLFEEREPGSNGKTYSTDKMAEKLKEDNNNRVDQHAMLRARMLDMFMLDFDRHEDQWRWGTINNDKGKIFYPIPRDRDQAFFVNSGLVPSIAAKDWLTPQLQGFKPHLRNINTYNFNAINLDRDYLNEIKKDEWKQEATRMVTIMTDSVIENALAKQPAAVYPYSAKKIIATLKARRSYLVQEIMDYYKFLAKQVEITGSDEREYFDINGHEDGSLRILVYKINKSGDTTTKLYDRDFFPGETKEIRLYGMGGEDKFVVHGSNVKTIKLRIIGGPGNDIVWDTASASRPALIYDLSSESNDFHGHIIKKLSTDPAVNYWERKGFKYNVLIPFVSVNYNTDDGVYLGLAFKYTSQGFRKNPYQFQQHLSVNHSLATHAYNFKYGLDITEAVAKLDFLLDADIRAPNNTINFFGYGNSSVFDKSIDDDLRYYRARFTYGYITASLRKKLSSYISISGGPSFQFYSMDKNDNENRFITKTAVNGLDSSTLYKNKSYAGGQIIFGIDNRNNKVLTSRGINWQTSFHYNHGLNGESKNFSQLSSDLSLFTSFSTEANLVIATRFGGGINFGHYEFFQAQFLNATDNLRGFRKFRFAGDKMVYNNTEVRIKLADFQTYLFPGRLGILFFNDIGKVWFSGQPSGGWHDGYGAGVWISPLNRFVITGSYMHSNEGGLPLVSFGFQF